jgi:hypothetical protein
MALHILNLSLLRSYVSLKQPSGLDRPPLAPPATKKEKPKSETYKQAWSISKQHLLERLLTEIPDGEKNRYVTSFHFALCSIDAYITQTVKNIKGDGRSPHSMSGRKSGLTSPITRSSA